MKAWKYVAVGTPETVQLKVATPAEGFKVLPKEATAKQAEAGFTGKRLLIHSDHGTIGIDVWNSNTAQIKEVVKTLSEGGEVAMSRKTQNRIDEETELVDHTAGIPNVFYDWSLPRVGQDAASVIAQL